MTGAGPTPRRPTEPGSGQDSPEAAVDESSPVIPEGVELGVEQLPPDFWEGTAAAQTSTGPRFKRSGEAPSEHPQAVQRVATTDRDGALARALLGSEAAGEGPGDGLTETVQALRELFPGEVVASRQRSDASSEDVDENSDEADDRRLDPGDGPSATEDDQSDEPEG